MLRPRARVCSVCMVVVSVVMTCWLLLVHVAVLLLRLVFVVVAGVCRFIYPFTGTHIVAFHSATGFTRRQIINIIAKQ